MLDEIRKTVLAEAAEGLGIAVKPDDGDNESDDAGENDSGVDLDAGVIDLDIASGLSADDADAKKADSKESGKKFIGGGGSGVTVSPVAFLVVGPDGSVELLNIGEKPASDPVSSIVGAVERSPELIERFKSVFGKDKNKEETDE